jgi:hypothetical protein
MVSWIKLENCKTISILWVCTNSTSNKTDCLNRINDCLNNLGIVQASLHKNSSAERSYYTALKHRKKYPDCYYNLGNLVWWLFFMLCLKCTCCICSQFSNKSYTFQRLNHIENVYVMCCWYFNWNDFDTRQIFDDMWRYNSLSKRF